MNILTLVLKPKRTSGRQGHRRQFFSMQRRNQLLKKNLKHLKHLKKQRSDICRNLIPKLKKTPLSRERENKGRGINDGQMGLVVSDVSDMRTTSIR